MANKPKNDNGGDLGASQVAKTLNEWNDQGFRGVKVDPTPNEAYTVAGVTGGAPTPETNDDLHAEAAAASNTDGSKDGE